MKSLESQIYDPAAALPTPRVIAFGVDTLWLFWRAPLSGQTLALLHALQAAGKGLPDAQWATVYLGGHTLRVRPHGSQDGSAYLLTDDAITVKLRPVPMAGMPSIQLELRSAWLWQLGADAAVADAQRVVEDLVPDHVVLHPAAMAPHVTRIDLCADFQGWDPTAGELVPESFHEKTQGKRSDAGGLRCEANKITPHLNARRKGGHTGCDYGSHGSEISGGIYDKTAEIEESSGKDWFTEVWSKSSDYDATARVWRLEYRLRREAVTGFLVPPAPVPEGAPVKEHLEETSGELVRAAAGVVPTRVETWADVKASMGSIWRYLTGKWLVWRGARTKRTRQVISPAWLPFHDLDEQLLHDGAKTVLRRKLSKVAPNIVAQVRGYLSVWLGAVRWQTKDKSLKLDQVLPWLVEEIELADQKAAASHDKLTMEEKSAKLLAAWQGLQPDHWSADGSELPTFDALAERMGVRARAAAAFAGRPRTEEELAARVERVRWASPERHLTEPPRTRENTA